MATNTKKVKLTAKENIFNVMVALVYPAGWVLYWLFFLRINQRRGPRVGRGIRVPRKVVIDLYATGHSFADTVNLLRQYGIACEMGNGGFVQINDRGNYKYRNCTLWVSPDQHWNADRQARAEGLQVVSAPVNCKRRGSSRDNVAKGQWRVKEPARINHALGGVVITSQWQFDPAQPSTKTIAKANAAAKQVAGSKTTSQRKR